MTVRVRLHEERFFEGRLQYVNSIEPPECAGHAMGVTRPCRPACLRFPPALRIVSALFDNRKESDCSRPPDHDGEVGIATSIVPITWRAKAFLRKSLMSGGAQGCGHLDARE